ncbi:hypothetical protein ACSBR2_017502 [Camellia fascicularis]
MDSCIFLEDDNSPRIGNNPTVPISEGSVFARSKRHMSRKAAKELFRRNQVIETEVHKFSNVLETFNQYLAEKEKKKAKREEKKIQALQQMKEFEIKRQELEIKRQEHEIKKEEHLIMTADISYLDPQIKAYHIM